jgi:hypothetical protein
LLSIALLLFEVFNGSFALVSLLDSILESGQIENFTFSPMINVYVGVLKVASDLA